MSYNNPVKNWILSDMDKMLDLLPIMEAGGFQIATWPGSGVYPDYHPVVNEFMDLGYNTSCFIQPYEPLPEDPAGVDPMQLLKTASEMENASINQIRRFFIQCLRAEKFCDGAIEGRFKDGRLLAALRRVKQIRESM